MSTTTHQAATLDHAAALSARRRRRLTTLGLLRADRSAAIARLAERADGLAVICDETQRPAEAAAARNIADDLRDLLP